MTLNRVDFDYAVLSKNQETELTYPMELKMEILESDFPVLLDGPPEGKKWALHVEITAVEEDAE